jgi:transposase
MYSSSDAEDTLSRQHKRALRPKPAIQQRIKLKRDATRCEVCGNSATVIISDICEIREGEGDPPIIRVSGIHYYCKAHERPAVVSNVIEI